MCVHSSAVNTHFFLISYLALNTDLGVLAIMNSLPQKDSEGLDNPSEDTISPEMLQEMLWLFRREDPSAWNYSILGLSILVLLIGVVLLGANIRANRNQKVLLLRKEGYEVTLLDEAEAKQAFVLLNKENPDQAGDNLLPQTPTMGDVMVRWKDGKTSPLYADANEAEA
ncbi:organic solute transporter subunit beta isoform X1 [Ahaetulla prasina]|uniref:organic solute transporter subunit beta isoform X1 n=1 Tax=Ahaetulla prasina TaxID=499056 RepID=UPI00264A2D73|nr:organic solute transporter subunit beta isoform X1 [Ahaetulla prasina]